LLLLHSWWGLNDYIKAVADRLSDHGFTVLAPELLAGAAPRDEESAREILAAADADHLVRLILTSAGLISRRSSGNRIGVIGLGMGGSLALWASVRLPRLVSATVSIYGSQAIDFAGSEADYQVHWADQDPYVSHDEAAFMEATIGLEARPVEVYRYPGTRHGFFEHGDWFDDEAAAVVWERMVPFLKERVA
jgi:carboxymethylenebutenolidase